MNLQNYQNLMLLTSSDTKRTLMHLLLFTNSAQRELVSIFTQSIHNRNWLSLHYTLGADQVTKRNYRRLPALERFYRENKFTLYKSTYSTKNLKTKLRIFLVCLPSSRFNLSQIGPWVPELWFGQTKRHTIEKLQLNIYRKRECKNIFPSFLVSCFM